MTTCDAPPPELVERARKRLDALLADLRQRLAGELHKRLSGYSSMGVALSDHSPTLGELVELVEGRADVVAQGLAADVAAAVGALIEPERQAAVLAGPAVERWPWRRVLAGPWEPDAALHELRIHARALDPHGTGLDDGAWIGTAFTNRALVLDVATWAQPKLDKVLPGPYWPHGSRPDDFAKLYPADATVGAVLLAEARLTSGWQSVPILTRADGGLVHLWFECLILLALAERPELVERDAARAVRRWDDKAPGDVHNDAARWALAQEPGAKPEALDLLARELWRHGPKLVKRLATTPPMVGELHGMLALDAALADWMDGVDRERADVLRDNARKRWTQYQAGELDGLGLCKLWLDGGAPALQAVAVTLWRSRVSERWERQQKHPPAAPAGVLDLLTAASHGSSQIHLPLDGIGPANLKDRRGRLLAEFPQAGLDADTLTQMFAGRALLGTVAGTRLIRWELVTAHRQWLEMHGTGGDFRRTVIAGGWSGLAELVGEHSKATVGELRAMVKAQAHGVFRLPSGGTGNLLGYDDKDKAGPGKPATLTLYWLDPLLPGYVHSLPAGRSGETHRRARVLVPLLDELPDLGHGRVAGAAALLHWLVLIDLAQGAPDLAKRGGVLLDWRKLWSDAGLSEDQGRRIRDMWTTDGDNAPAMLEHVGGGRYALGKTHERAQAFILARNTLAEEKATKKRR